MARDRILFFISFAVLGLVAVFLFSKKAPEPEKAPEVKTEVVAPKTPDALPLAPGKIAVPFLLNARAGVVQFLSPGKNVDIIYTSKADSGLGTITLTLLDDVRVIGIGKDAEGRAFSDKSSFYKPNTAIEILLEMTPRQAEILYFAQHNGDVTIGIDDEHAVQRRQANDTLAQELLKSDSNENFNSIIVTHMMRSLFPNADLKIISTPKGYIVSGQADDPVMSEKIVQILELLTGGESKTVVSLLSVAHVHTEEALVPEEEAELDINSYSVSCNKRSVLIELNSTFPTIPCLCAGSYVDLKFTSRSDVGFTPVTLTLLRRIKVLAAGKNIVGKRIDRAHLVGEPMQYVLEMTPRQAEIYSFAMSSGFVSLENHNPALMNECNAFLDTLFESDSVENFQSHLITHTINTLFPLVNINVTSSPKGYIVQGRVPDPQMAGKIIDIITRLIPRGEKAVINLMDIQPQQVLISVRAYEVRKDFLSRFGINWEVLFRNLNQSFGVASIFPRPPLSEANYVVAAGGQFCNYSLSAILDMLEEQEYTKILAEPNLTTISGETAHFFAGGEYPILVPQGGNLIGTVTVEYKKYGVLLDFTPIVDLNGLITMHVVPEVSNLDRANSVVISGFVIPGLQTRRVDTIVKLWPGQSYVIAGLYLDNVENRNANLYGLNRLPFIGGFFGSNRYEDHRTELLVVVTPYLMYENKPPEGTGIEIGKSGLELDSCAKACASSLDNPHTFYDTHWQEGHTAPHIDAPCGYTEISEPEPEYAPTEEPASACDAVNQCDKIIELPCDYTVESSWASYEDCQSDEDCPSYEDCPALNNGTYP